MALLLVLLPILPNSKISVSWRKNVLFSGKNRLNLVKFTCLVSTSVEEKSVLNVSAPFSDGVILYNKSKDGSLLD